MSKYVVAITGASGSLYATGLIKELLTLDKEVILMVTDAARIVMKEELSLSLPLESQGVEETLRQYLGVKDKGSLTFYSIKDLMAPIASGSSRAEAVIVVPCSMGTLAHIATGMSSNLLERCADVMLKEKGNLVLVPRETPLSSIHLKNMLVLSEMGVRIIPAMPAYYHHPQSINDLRDFLVGRILDSLNLVHNLYIPWGKEESKIERK